LLKADNHPEKRIETMAWTKKKSTVLAGLLIVALIAGAVKVAFFPSIKDAYFAMDNRGLQQAPAGLVIVRPTHFPFLRRNGIFYAQSPRKGDPGRWMMGRNVPLREVIAVAYDGNSARVVLPPDAPNGNFDFLVTVTRDPGPRLQKVIRRKLGCVAQKETRDTDVLALKIMDARLPGLTVSRADEKERMFYNDSKLRFWHRRLAVLSVGLGQYLSTPVMDQTGLTNFYNFAIIWDPPSGRCAITRLPARPWTKSSMTWGWGWCRTPRRSKCSS
jgi:uncharacterized protein (TIGR03435 family)